MYDSIFEQYESDAITPAFVLLSSVWSGKPRESGMYPKAFATLLTYCDEFSFSLLFMYYGIRSTM